MSSPLPSEVHPDPGRTQAAIERHREIAKYLLGIFAAIGGLLLAGTQLSSLGQLSFSDDPVRLLAAVVAFACALVAVLVIVSLAVLVLRPVEMSLEEVVADPFLREAVDAQKGLLAGASSVEAVQELLGWDLEPGAQRKWRGVVAEIVDYAAFRVSQERFDKALKRMLAAAVVAAGAIAVFAYAANPPKDEPPAGSIVPPSPERIDFSLTREGRETLEKALGARCVRHSVAALAIGGSREAPLVVALPRGGCHPAQFVLSPGLGVATAVP